MLCSLVNAKVISDEPMKSGMIFTKSKLENLRIKLYTTILLFLVVAVPRSTLLKESHGGKFAGHFAERKIYTTLRTKYWWKGDVRQKLSCVCFEERPRSVAYWWTLSYGWCTTGLHGLFYEVAWSRRSNRGNYRLVEHVIARHGVPEQLLSDRGANFLSTLLQVATHLDTTRNAMDWWKSSMEHSLLASTGILTSYRVAVHSSFPVLFVVRARTEDPHRVWTPYQIDFLAQKW